MKRKEIVLVGGGGHCKSCIDVIESAGTFVIKGIVDTQEKVGGSVLGYEIIGSDRDIPRIAKKVHSFLITLGQIKSAAKRKELFDKVNAFDVIFPAIISPHAHVSRHAQIGMGSIVMHQAMINADARIGKNCIINTGAVIEHDCDVGDFCHVSTGAIINGGVHIGNDCFIGSGAITRETITIEEGTVIGAGSVIVMKKVAAGLYSGNPARKRQ